MPNTADLLTLACPVEILQASAGDGAEKPARLEAVAYAGGEMKPPGWPKLVIDLRGLTLPSQVPVLADHENHVQATLGHGTPTIESGRLIVRGLLTRGSEATERFIKLTRDGLQLGASVGVEASKRENLRAGDRIEINGRTITAGPGGLLVIRAGLLREISLTAVAADNQSSVSIAASFRRTENMPTSTDNQTSDILTGERDRIALINASCDRLSGGLVSEQLGHRLNELRASAVADGWTSDKLTAELQRLELDAYRMRELRAGMPRGPLPRAGNDQHNGDVLQAALLCHMGKEAIAVKSLGERATQAGRDLHCNHVLDIIKAGFQMTGAPIPATPDEMIKASATIFSLPGILGNVANKLLLDAYQAVPSVARIIAKRLTAKNFKAHTGYRLTGDSKFEELAPDGNIRHGKLTEAAYPYRVDTYAKMYGLTRQDLINDDLGAFDSMPQIIGRGAAVKLEEVFWTLVLANTATFFATGNGNYIEGATTNLSITSLGAAVTKMRQQTDTHGAPVMVVPKYLVVPPELEATADGLYASTNIALAGATDIEKPDGNPYKGKYEPLVVPHLSNSTYSGYSVLAWYLFGLPSDVAAFGIAYLNGVENPTVESSMEDFSRLGMQFRGYLDFGVCQIDHRGAVKAKGEA